MNELMQQFHFLRPLWLLAIIPLSLLIYLVIRAKRRQGQWHQLLPNHLAKLLIEDADTTRKKHSGIIMVLCAIIVSIALAGPTWQRIEQPLFKVKQAQVIITDMSLSLYATDLAPNRLTRAKFKIKDLISRLSEGETGLIAYAGDAFVISPMTQDIANLNNLLPALNPNIMPVYGSEPSLAIEQALELLAQTNHTQGQIYLITDGLEPGDARAITQQLKNTQYQLNILGVGTAKGAPIKLPNGQLLKDDNGNIVIPKLQVSILRNLSDTLDGRYSNLTHDQSDIDYLTQTRSPDEIDEDVQDKQFGDEWHEMGPYLVLLLLPFAALVFRRGVLTALTVSLLVSTIHSTPIYATTMPPKVTDKEQQTISSSANSWWKNLWKTPNQQGYEAYQQQKFDQASTNFENADWLGAAHYKQGNFEQALAAFDKSTQPSGLFNQANSLAQMQNYDEAIKRLESLITQQPDFPNAKENLEIIKQLAKQQKQQQQQKGQSGDDDKSQQQEKSSQDNDSQQNKNQPQDSEQKNNDAKNGEQNQQQTDEEQSDSTNKQQDNQQQSEQEAQEQQNNQQKTLSDEEQKAQDAAKKAAEQKQKMFNEDNLTPEQLQRLNQLVKKIPDDPSLLLKNKMAVEAQKRQHQRVTRKDRKKW